MIKRQGDKWLVDIQPGGRGHKRFREAFTTKAEARRFELTIQSRIAVDTAYSLPKKDLRKLTDFVKLWYDSTGQFLNSGKDSYQRMIQASAKMGDPVMSVFKPVFLSNIALEESTKVLNRPL